MKWIGQHIWSFISRFRNDVYLEDLSTTTETNILVSDSDGKVSKRAMSSLTSGTVTVTDSNTSTAFPIVFHDESNNLLDDTGTFTYNPNLGVFDLKHSSQPTISLYATGNDVLDPHINFYNTRGGNAGVDNDDLGSIVFWGNNNEGTPNTMTFAHIKAQIEERDDTDEAGKIFIQTLTSNGTAASLVDVIRGTGHATNNTVDIGLGYGTASTTTIAGDLTVSGGDIMGPTDSDLNIKSDTNIILDSDTDADGGHTYVKFKGAGTERFSFHTSRGAQEVTSEIMGYPQLNLISTSDDASSATLRFTKKRLDSSTIQDGEDNDSIGSILFASYDDGTPTSQIYASIEAQIADATSGQEAGKLSFKVVEYDGSSNSPTTGLLLDGDTNADGEIDVTIGAGAASDTTIAGNLTVTSDLTVSGTTTTINTTNLNVEDKNITLNYNNSSDTSGTADGAGITIQDAVDASNDASLTWVAASDKFSFSHAVDITNGASGGVAALTIDNDDVDTNALLIEAANTTEHILDIEAGALTTHDAIHIKADALTTGAAINLDINDSLTTSATKSLVKVDYDKSGVTGSAQASITTGLDINMTDAATNNAGGVVRNLGIGVTLDAASNQGQINQTGIALSLTDADAAGSVGIYSLVEDGGIDFKAVSSANASDYFAIEVGAEGATTLTTVDADTAAANFEIAADGNITLDPAGTIALEADTTITGNLTVSGGNIYGPTDGGLSLRADTDMIFVIDEDNDGSNNFVWYANGYHGSKNIMQLSEAGELQVGGFGSTTGKITIFDPANDAGGPELVFNKARDFAGLGGVVDAQDDDVLGSIMFTGYDDGTPSTQTYAGIKATISDVTSGQEAGRLELQVAEYDGAVTSGLMLDGDTNADGEIDVTIGSGVGSTTTIVGNTSFSSYATITNGSTTGQTALTIDNDDIDQIALNIDAANTTAHVVNIDAPALTTGHVVDIRCDALTNGNPIHVLHNDGLTTDINRNDNGLIRLDYNKSGNVGGGQTVMQNGINLTMNDAATSNAGTMNMTGIKMVVDSASTNGTVSNTGIDMTVTDSDINNGIVMQCEDGAGFDIKLISSASVLDYFTIATGEDGETTFTTVENGGGSTAHMNFNVDGDIIFDPASSKVVKLVLDDGSYDGTGAGLNVHAGGEALPFFVANAESGNFSSLYLFEEGGATMADYFYITTGTSSETTIGTIDAAGADASLSFSIDGYVKFQGDGVEVENPTDSGREALLIDNNDVDQIALSIDAENTTANVINVDAGPLTTGKALYIDSNSYTDGTFIHVDVDDANTGDSQKTLMGIDYDKSGVTGSGNNNNTVGLSIDLQDSATNHASGNTSTRGLYINVDADNAAGTIYGSGIDVNVFADGVGDLSVTNTFGIRTRVIDGAPDIVCRSHADTGDYFSIATTTHGATTFTTVDDDATAADLTFNIDGDIILDPHTGEDIYFKENGTERFQFHLDSTPTMEVTGNFDIEPSGTLDLKSGINQINKIYDFNATTFENDYSDDVGSGTILRYSPGADESPAGSELFFLHTDGTWNQTDADAVATGASQLLGVGLGASARTTGVLLKGFVRINSTEILNVPGSGAVDGLPVYVSTTAGHFDFTAPSGSGDFVRIVGYAIDDYLGRVLIYFDPDKSWVEIA